MGSIYSRVCLACQTIASTTSAVACFNTLEMLSVLSKLSVGAPSVLTAAFGYRGMAVTAKIITEKLKAELQTAEVVCRLYSNARSIPSAPQAVGRTPVFCLSLPAPS